MLPANFFVVWKNLEEGYRDLLNPTKSVVTLANLQPEFLHLSPCAKLTEIQQFVSEFP
jgi:hypothetical protein